MTNAERILSCLDDKLQVETELTLYGRAALQLGFERPRPDFAQSLDVDVVLWVGQAEELLDQGNLWQAIEEVNGELASDQLYISHFFEENQVVLTPNWRAKRVRLEGPWTRLRLYRLSNEDLFLSKCMRNDPIDLSDAQFILQQSGWSKDEIQKICASARIPDVPELAEQFSLCVEKLLATAK